MFKLLADVPVDYQGDYHNGIIEIVGGYAIPYMQPYQAAYESEYFKEMWSANESSLSRFEARLPEIYSSIQSATDINQKNYLIALLKGWGFIYQVMKQERQIQVIGDYTEATTGYYLRIVSIDGRDVYIDGVLVGKSGTTYALEIPFGYNGMPYSVRPGRHTLIAPDPTGQRPYGTEIIFPEGKDYFLNLTPSWSPPSPFKDQPVESYVFEIRSVPSGAKIYIDTVDSGLYTNAKLTPKDIRAGTHFIYLVKDGYWPSGKDISIGTKGGAMELILEVKPVIGPDDIATDAIKQVMNSLGLAPSQSKTAINPGVYDNMVNSAINICRAKMPGVADSTWKDSITRTLNNMNIVRGQAISTEEVFYKVVYAVKYQLDSRQIPIWQGFDTISTTSWNEITGYAIKKTTDWLLATYNFICQDRHLQVLKQMAEYTLTYYGFKPGK